MASEILKKIRTAFYSIIKVEAMNTSRGTGHKAFLRLCEHYCRLIECFHKTGCHDSDNSLMPLRIIYDCRIST